MGVILDLVGGWATSAEKDIIRSVAAERFLRGLGSYEAVGLRLQDLL